MKPYASIAGTMILLLAGVHYASAQQTFTICTGEHESACKSHDVYLYCYVKIVPVATKMCKDLGLSGDHNIARLNTYGGNKCGYSIDRVVCR